MNSAEQGGKVKRPWTGAELQDVSSDLAKTLGLARPEGALIVSLHAQSPLLAAGLKRGDVILALDGKPIENAREFSYRVATSPIDSSTIVEYQRSGTRMEARARLIQAPETTARETTLVQGKTPFAGLMVANLSPAVAEELNLPASSSGVVAVDIKGGPARRIFRKGDILMEVNGTLIDSVGKLSAALQSAEGYWEFAINRNGRVLRMQLGG